jgi:hypothetical protein
MKWFHDLVPQAALDARLVLGVTIIARVDPERLPRGPISGMLDRDHITRTSQRTRRERKRHLAAASDEDGARFDCQTARRGQHRGQRFTKPRQTCWIGVGDQCRSEAMEHAAVRASDQISGYGPDIRSCA